MGRREEEGIRRREREEGGREVGRGREWTGEGGRQGWGVRSEERTEEKEGGRDRGREGRGEGGTDGREGRREGGKEGGRWGEGVCASLCFHQKV